MKYIPFICSMSEHHNSKEFEDILQILSKKFSTVSEVINLKNWTAPFQYRLESGEKINLKFIFFTDKLTIKDIAELKRHLMFEEYATSENKKRKFNLNPGYLSKEGLFVFTHKPNPLRGRIKFAEDLWIEKQLDFMFGQFQTNSNTFSEYSNGIDLFNSKIRTLHKNTATNMGFGVIGAGRCNLHL